MSRKIKCAVAAVLAGLALAIGLNLTGIVVRSFTKNTVSLYEAPFFRSELISNGSRGEAFIQNAFAGDTIGLRYDIYGGAFVMTDYPNEERSTCILLRNMETGKIYQITTDLYSRPDIYKRKQEQFHLNTEYNYGFYASFSPAMIKEDGIYEAFVLVKENDEDGGVFETGKRYRKKGKSFSEWQYYFFTPKMVDLFGEQLSSRDMRAYASGMSVREQLNFAWSIGDSSEFHFTVPEKGRNVRCVIDVYTTITDGQRVIITADGTELYHETLSGSNTIEFVVPAESIRDGELSFLARYPDSLIPKAEGIGDDPNQLSIAFNHVSLSYE